MPADVRPLRDEVHEHVKTYIEASARATTRSRDILILIIIVSVLIFGAFWNSRQGSWINERLQMDVTATKYLKLLSDADQMATINVQKTVELRALAADHQFDAVREYLKIRPYLNTVDAINTAAHKLVEIQTEHVLYLHLPFFGFFIDVNDLGLLGGFTFTLLLLWLRFSMWHELNNLNMTFREARNHQSKKFCYEALAMHQVLTIPQSLDDKASRGHWQYVVKALLLLPFAIHLTIFCFDSFSFSYGWSISAPNTVIGTAVSGLFLLCISALTFVCFVLSGDIDAKWNNTADEIRRSTPEEATAP